jgi:hypothetical protein
MSFTNIAPNGESDGIPTDVAWNRAAARFQETNNDGFQPESKNPPHHKR